MYVTNQDTVNEPLIEDDEIGSQHELEMVNGELAMPSEEPVIVEHTIVQVTHRRVPLQKKIKQSLRRCRKRTKRSLKR